MSIQNYCKYCRSTDGINTRTVLGNYTSFYRFLFVTNLTLCDSCYFNAIKVIQEEHGDEIYNLILHINKLAKEGREWQRICGKFINENEIEITERLINSRIRMRYK